MAHAPLFPPVIVNGVEIPSTAIADEAQNHTAPTGKPGIAWRKGAQALILRHLLLEAARAHGLTASPRSEADRVETEDEALIRAYLEDQIEVMPIAEATLLAVYEANPERFRAPDLFEASHILIASNADRAEAEALAKATLAKVKAAPKSFAREAKAISDCPSGKSGGALGQHSPGDLDPTFEAALQTLSEGEIYPEHVESKFGFHIIRCDARARGQVLPFDAVKPRLMRAAEQRAWAEAANALADDLVQKARIEGIEMGQMAA